VTIYTIGDEGATVFDERGRLLARLRPGAVVVPGDVQADADEPSAPEREHPTRRGYDDKVIRPEQGPTATRPTPPRQPDARLRNPLAGSG
jgi:hypothetical protein